MTDPRYIVVSDLPEFTVNDTETGRDLFPTQSFNRSTYCKRVDEDTARMIADALNLRSSVRSLVGEWRKRKNALHLVEGEQAARGDYIGANEVMGRADAFEECADEISALIDGKGEKDGQ